MHVVARPRHAVAHAIGRRTVAVEHVLNHKLAVACHVHGAADSNVAGHIIAHVVLSAIHANALLGTNSARRQADAAGVHRATTQKFVALWHAVAHRGRCVGDIHLTCLAGGKSGVFLHKDDGDLLHLGRVAVIIRVGGKDDLLTLVPLRELVAATANGRGAVVGTVGVLGHDAQHSKRVKQRVVGLGHVQRDGCIVNSHSLLDAGEVCLGFGRRINSVDGKGNVGCCKRLTVGKVHVIANDEGPSEPIIAALVGRGKIVDEL